MYREVIEIIMYMYVLNLFIIKLRSSTLFRFQDLCWFLRPIHTSRGNVTCVFCGISDDLDCDRTLGPNGW